MTKGVGVVEATDVRPFNVSIPEAELAELRKRIVAMRWPEKETVSDFTQGVPLATVQKLASYWASNYDWRKVEARLNAVPNFITEIDGLDIHFIHVRSKHENALPVIITHGWPGSVVEQLKLIEPLTNPTAHGGSAEDAFDVVIPSMPGYGFSGKPTVTGWGPERIARAWDVLMKRLGYTRYVAQGGDWGAVVVDMMGVQSPSGLARHSHEHGRHFSSRHRRSRLLWRSDAGGSLRRRADRLRAIEVRLCEGHRLRLPDGPATTVALRDRRFYGNRVDLPFIACQPVVFGGEHEVLRLAIWEVRRPVLERGDGCIV